MIRFQNVFKFYRAQKTLKIVLDHISFRLDKGVSYGIMGINGAGKSTLMRLIAGTEMPNSGRIVRDSRVSWPLGFAGGLHPALTGRENIQFVARVYRQDIRKAVRFVEDFAELGPFIDAPFGTYSSGMQQRLAFGLSMAIDFDCYLIDEVMAVGDSRFQQRCRDEFNKRKQYSDMIMISHSIELVQMYCDRGIVLADGKMYFFDSVSDAVEMYKQLNM
ncbi:ABC transporter ATP-binding protein [Stappia sp. TSB10GB4]|uniref:ABC transporter ATP-binding protein n=1 Tax=Stappia sp. TSB10GB4 TaxID=2003584 RepID=UPI0016455590|nr:ATP-binding cassette domain-containing protein [Stappia sp. TSB10GB4]